MELPPEVVDDVIKRLRRVEGQLRGLQAMLAEGRECRDIVTQLSTARRALDQAGFKVMASGLTYCLAHPVESEAAGYSLDELERLFLKLA